ncbi:MAG: ATP-binding protein [Candidatus Dormibacteria bacterium]
MDGWQANRLATLYGYVVRVLTSSVGDATRYWFVDEVTACRGPWWSTVKNLRDNTDFGRDCVVLTGSSNRGLDEATKAFAGRRGPVTDPDRVLLPMDFGDFCRSLSVRVPAIEGLRADELRSNQARDTWLGLAPYTDDLVAAWQAYLEVGGYPKAVGDWRRANRIETPTWQAIWDVAWGDAVTNGMNEAVLSAVLNGMAVRLTSLTAVTGFANEVGIARETLLARLEALTGAFLAWNCPRADSAGRPDRRKQQKIYFLDPLIARLPQLVQGQPSVDITRLSEQQLGVALLQWNERVRPGAIRAGSWVTHYRGETGEVDFAGVCPDSLLRATPLESKYVSESWRRGALGIRNSALGSGILATRGILEVAGDEPVWAVPASFVAFALSCYRSPRPAGSKAEL